MSLIERRVQTPGCPGLIQGELSPEAPSASGIKQKHELQDLMLVGLLVSCLFEPSSLSGECVCCWLLLVGSSPGKLLRVTAAPPGARDSSG